MHHDLIPCLSVLGLSCGCREHGLPLSPHRAEKQWSPGFVVLDEVIGEVVDGWSDGNVGLGKGQEELIAFVGELEQVVRSGKLTSVNELPKKHQC